MSDRDQMRKLHAVLICSILLEDLGFNAGKMNVMAGGWLLVADLAQERAISLL
jgi:hypothetical protein